MDGGWLQSVAAVIAPPGLWQCEGPGGGESGVWRPPGQAEQDIQAATECRQAVWVDRWCTLIISLSHSSLSGKTVSKKIKKNLGSITRLARTGSFKGSRGAGVSQSGRRPSCRIVGGQQDHILAAMVHTQKPLPYLQVTGNMAGIFSLTIAGIESPQCFDLSSLCHATSHRGYPD